MDVWTKKFGKIHVILNGIELSRYQFSATQRQIIRRHYRISSTMQVIGFVGVLATRKNPFFAISTFEAFHAKHSDNLLVMLGKGPLESEIVARINDARLQHHFIQLDYLKNVNEMVLSNGRTFFPTPFEEFRLVPVEAQVSNLKVLCADVVPHIPYCLCNVKY